MSVVEADAAMMEWLNGFGGVNDTGECAACTEALLLIGDWKADIQDVESAVAHYERAAQIDVADATAWLRQGIALEAEAGRDRNRNGNGNGNGNSTSHTEVAEHEGTGTKGSKRADNRYEYRYLHRAEFAYKAAHLANPTSLAVVTALVGFYEKTRTAKQLAQAVHILSSTLRLPKFQRLGTASNFFWESRIGVLRDMRRSIEADLAFLRAHNCTRFRKRPPLWGEPPCVQV
jgi:tetratricopeptide (TPR) repeat protein